MANDDGKCYKIYNGLKDLRLNKIYYGERLTTFKNYNLVLEVLIALGASGSGIAGIAVLKTDSGKIAWGVLSAISIVLAICKPFLKLSDRVSAYSKLYGEYATGDARAKAIVDDMQVDHSVMPARMKEFDAIRKRVGELAGLGDTAPDRMAVKRIQGEVNRQIDINKLWLPSDP